MQKHVHAPGSVAFVVLCLAGAAVSASAQGETCSLQTGRAPGTVDLVQAALEVGGELKMGEKRDGDPVKMAVSAKFVYDEKSLSLPAAGPLRSIRRYRLAEGVIQSGEHDYKPALREERRLIGVEADGPKVTLFSPQGPLTFEELELIDVLANTVLLDRLLPAKPVAVGTAWRHPDELVAAMLGLDTITSSDVQSALTDVADGKASLEISGRVQGGVDGVSTEIELKGEYHFDIEARRITWVGLAVSENRSVGHVDTGFDVVARLQMKITPATGCEDLSDAALAGLALEPTPEVTRLSYESAGGKWRLAHDRRWYVITEEPDQAVLRLIDGGDKVAQCNVAMLPQGSDAAELNLEGFQRDVVRALGDSFQNLVRASQRHSEADYRVFQVVAEGETSGVPMLWSYYLVTDRHGRRVVLAFVLEKSMLDRFDQADQGLVSTLRLADPKVASKPATEPPRQGGRW
jgi:hypothetical protein